MSRKDAELSSDGEPIDIDKDTTSSDEDGMITGVKIDDDKRNLIQASTMTMPQEVGSVGGV